MEVVKQKKKCDDLKLFFIVIRITLASESSEYGSG